MFFRGGLSTCKASEASVAQGRIPLLFVNVFKMITELAQRVRESALDAEIARGVAEEAADEELERQVVHAKVLQYWREGAL